MRPSRPSCRSWPTSLIAALLVAGAAFALSAPSALAKLSDFYKRLHGPTKATTLGVGGVLLASALYFCVRGPALSLHELLITLFLFLTAPVSAHLLVEGGTVPRAARRPADRAEPRTAARAPDSCVQVARRGARATSIAESTGFRRGASPAPA